MSSVAGEVVFAADWAGVQGVFGGKVIADVAESARAVAETDGLDLASVHVEFTGGGRVGTATMEPTVVHRGRSTATVRVECTQVQASAPGAGARRIAGGVAKFVAPGSTTVLGPHTLPEAPTPDELAEFVPPWGELSYDHKFEVRLISHAEEDGVPTTRAWVRARPGTGLGEHGTVVALLDVLPPGLFMRAPMPKFVPTVDFAMHLDASAPIAEGEWAYGVMRTDWAGDEFCLETATLHHADGRFVARGTQTRRIVR